MVKILYIRIILIAIFTIFVVSSTYWFYSSSKVTEVPTLAPSKNPYKIPAQADEDLLSLDSNNAFYDSFTKNKKNIPTQISLSPEPEDPIALVQEAEIDNVFSSGNLDDVEMKKTNNMGKEEEPGLNLTIQQKDAHTEQSSIPQIQGGSVWDIKENVGTIDAEQKKTQNLNVTTVKQLNITPQKNKKDKIGYFMQLGIYRSEVEAKKEWAKIKFNNKKLIGLREPKIKKVKKSNALYYELLAGPYEQFKSAKYACNKIILKKQKCIVARDNL